MRPDFDAARDAAVQWLRTRTDVAGLLFFGSAARGEATDGSDLDFYAVTHADTHGHLGRRVLNVPVEVSFGSITQWRQRVERALPAVVHAFASGRVLADRTNGALAALCADAAALWARGPSRPGAEALLSLRFRLTDLVRDVEDTDRLGAETALAGAECVQVAINTFFAVHGAWLPPVRHALAVLRTHDDALAAAVRACADGGFPAPAVVAVADTVLAPLGGRLEEYDTTEIVST